MARKPMMAGNWKMNKTVAAAVVLTQEIVNRVDKHDTEMVDVVMCTPFTNLGRAIAVIDFEKSDIAVGAQNVYWEQSGAYTGEISAEMLKEVGCEYCIVGHSERREMFGDSDINVNLKVKALLAYGIRPIVCVGESLQVREDGDTINYVCEQLRMAFAGLEADEVAKCVVAYEPIWAIGTGRTATPEMAEEVCAALRECVEEVANKDCADSMRILYGGSMNPANVEGLLAMDNIDGGLIGGASLKAEDFTSLIKACQ